MRQVAQGMGGVLPVLRQGLGARQQTFTAIQPQGGKCGRAGHRMRRIGVAVEELDAFRALHEGLVDGVAHEHGAHRHAAVGQPLGEGDDVGRDAKLLRGEWRTGAAEASDHLIENQQDPVAVADLA